MKSGMKTFAVKIPGQPTEEQIDALQQFMNNANDAMVEYAQEVAEDLNISESLALDVVYLRGRSRWTPELEAELIRRTQAGEKINIGEFGHKE